MTAKKQRGPLEARRNFALIQAQIEKKQAELAMVVDLVDRASTEKPTRIRKLLNILHT